MILQVPWQWWIHEAPHDYFRFSPYGLKHLFEKAGFSDVQIEAQAGYFSTAVLKWNYFTRRLVRGPKSLKLFLELCLSPFWYLGQKAAPYLDKLDKNWPLESSGYYVTAKSFEFEAKHILCGSLDQFCHGGSQRLNVCSMIVLARLLAPGDFGLIALVWAVMALVNVFTDLGVSNALIHHQNVSKHQLSSLYWLNVSVGLAFAIVLLLAANPISLWVLNQPGLAPLLQWMSIAVLLTSIGQQLRVMAEKALNFSVIAKIEITAVIAGFVTAVGWAITSPSVYALVAGGIVVEAVKTLLLLLFASQGWRPTLRLRLTEVREFLGFGGYVMANNLVNSINYQADVFLAGRLFPIETVGVYSVPRNLSLQIAGAINPVVSRVGFPVMAKVQDDQTQLKKVYLETLRMTASVNFPLYLALAVFSVEIVEVLLGERWLDSAPVLSVLAVWGLMRSCGNPVGSLLLAVGRADLSFKWNVALLLIVPPSLWFAAHWGIIGLATGQAALMTVLMMPAWYFLVRPNCGASAWEYANSLVRPLLCALPAVSVAYVGSTFVLELHYRLLVAVFVAMPAYILMSLVLNREWLIAMRQLVLNR